MRITQAGAREVAEDLTLEAISAGLTVVTLSPHPCRAESSWCLRVDLRTGDGGCWMEATHESESSVRRAIVLYGQGNVREHTLVGVRGPNRDGSLSAFCACGETSRAFTAEVAKKGIWEHREWELQEAADMEGERDQ